MILSGENVAGRPAHLGAQLDQRLNQHGGLNGHVNTAENSGVSQRLLVGILLSQRHQSRHLGFGQGDLATTKVSQTDVGDFVVVQAGDVVLCNCSTHGVLLSELVMVKGD